MTQELIIKLPEEIYPEKQSYVIDYCYKNRSIINKFCALYGTGKMTLATALSLSNLSNRTYYRIVSFAKAGIEYCEYNNINYNNTDFKDLIDAYNLIIETKQTASQNILDKLFDKIDDKIIYDQDGKSFFRKGDGNLGLRLLEKLDPDYADKSGTSIDINVENSESGFVGVNITLLDLNTSAEKMAQDQEKLFKSTREKK